MLRSTRMRSAEPSSPRSPTTQPRRQQSPKAATSGTARCGAWRSRQRDPAAASVYVTLTGGDEVVVGIGQTHAYIWDDDPTALAEYLRVLLDAVFAGDFEEAGLGDAFARVHLRDGTTVRLGNMHLPLPWRVRRTRRYAPLSRQQRE